MYIADVESGYFVNSNHQRMAEIVHDFDPHLIVQWIPPAMRTTEEDKKHPYRIIHDGTGAAQGQPYEVMRLSEEDMDGRVIEKLFLLRVDKNDIPARIKAQYDALKAIGMKQFIEEQEAKRDLDIFRLKTPLHTFKHEGKVYRA